MTLCFTSKKIQKMMITQKNEMTQNGIQGSAKAAATQYLLWQLPHSHANGLHSQYVLIIFYNSHQDVNCRCFIYMLHYTFYH